MYSIEWWIGSQNVVYQASDEPEYFLLDFLLDYILNLIWMIWKEIKVINNVFIFVKKGLLTL